MWIAEPRAFAQHLFHSRCGEVPEQIQNELALFAEGSVVLVPDPAQARLLPFELQEPAANGSKRAEHQIGVWGQLGRLELAFFGEREAQRKHARRARPLGELQETREI